jgi:hypothetical protein
VLRPGGLAIVAVYHSWSVAFAGLLARELAAGRLFRQSWRRTLSRIEAREHSDACPLVKLYSRRQARTLFRDFRPVRVRTRHFGPAVPERFRPLAERAAALAGWYVIVEASRP